MGVTSFLTEIHTAGINSVFSAGGRYLEDIGQLKGDLASKIHQLHMEYPQCEWLELADKMQDSNNLSAACHSEHHASLYPLSSLTNIGKTHNGSFN